MCLGNLAHQQTAVSDLQSAESNLRRQIKLAKEIKAKETLDVPYSELGRGFSICGSFDVSLKELNNAMKISEESNTIQYQSVIWSFHSLRSLLMNEPEEALKCANKALEFAIKTEETQYRYPRDFIRANLYLGASHIALAKGEKGEDIKTHLRQAEKYLQGGYSYKFEDEEEDKRHSDGAIVECRRINSVDTEAEILLQLAKLAKLQGNDEEGLKLATEALEIAQRCSYVLQQADVEEFLGEYYMGKGDRDEARKWLNRCIESCQHCWRYNKDTKDFDYIKKDKEWWYLPRHNSATALLSSLNPP